jgi:hypothetical protein
MEEITLQQMESLENTLKFQARKIHIFESHLKELAKIESKLIIFGSVSDEEQLDKQIILAQYR